MVVVFFLVFVVFVFWYLVNCGIDVGSFGIIIMGGVNFFSFWCGVV